MNFTFENHGSNTYLVCELSSEKVDTMSLGMLTNNNIEGIAETTVVQVNDKKYIKFKVSSMVSVAQMLTGPVNRRRLLGIFIGIVDAMLSAEEYMLDVNTLVRDLNYIFTDVSTCKTVMICLPVEGYGQKEMDMGSFFKRLIVEIQPDPTESCEHIGMILTYLNSNSVLSLANFKEKLVAISKGGSTMPVQRYVQPVQPQPVQPQPVQPQVAAQPIPQTVPRQPEIRQQPVAEQRPQLHIPQPVNPAPQMMRPTPTQPPKKQPQKKHEMLKPPGTPKGTQPVQPENQEKEISWFYLMQHYNSENAALYKAQKQAKKAAKNGQQPVQPEPGRTPAAPQRVNAGFAIPGQQPPAPAAMVRQPQQSAVPPVQFQQTQRPQQQPTVLPVQSQQPQPQVWQQPAVTQQQTQISSTVSPMFQGQSMNFGETTVLGGGGVGETTVLGEAATMQVKPHLVRVKNNEKIDISKPVFRIGKEKSYVDYFISDNSAISRSHANIITRNGEYFAVDTNSTNHTYVNGQMVQSNVETKIVHGTRIRLANEDFEFKIY